jgi:hypothetical protein
MKKKIECWLLLLMFPAVGFGCDETPLIPVNSAEVPKVIWSKDQDYCGGTPVLDLMYPSALNGEELTSAHIKVESDGKIIMDLNLASFPSGKESYFCLDEALLKGAQLTIDYGYDNCMGFVYRYVIDDLFSLKSKGAINLKQDTNGRLR